MGAEVYLRISIGAPPALGIGQHTILPPPPPMVAGDCHILTTIPGRHHSHEEKTNGTASLKRRPLNPFASVPDEDDEEEEDEEEGSR